MVLTMSNKSISLIEIITIVTAITATVATVVQAWVAWKTYHREHPHQRHNQTRGNPPQQHTSPYPISPSSANEPSKQLQKQTITIPWKSLTVTFLGYTSLGWLLVMGFTQLGYFLIIGDTQLYVTRAFAVAIFLNFLVFFGSTYEDGKLNKFEIAIAISWTVVYYTLTISSFFCIPIMLISIFLGDY